MALAHFPVDHHFGLQILPDDLEAIMTAPSLLRTLHLAPRVGKKDSKSLYTKDGFKVCLDVQQFAPNEITVKTTNNSITIEGRHEEKEDEHHGFISRHFLRRYELPRNYDIETVKSALSSDGILTVRTAPPRKSIGGAENERNIPVEMMGPAREAINGIFRHNGDAVQIK